MNLDGSKKQMRVVFSGRVQGVGFRYTTCRIAQRFKLAGYVRNLDTGDVRVVAEGSESELIDFFNAIRESQLGRHIIREHLQWVNPTEKYEVFGVSFE